jgi:hypothetical protein
VQGWRCMDWIAKIEEQDRKRAQESNRTSKAYSERRANELPKETAHFRIIVEKLRPIIEKRIADIKARLGTSLRLDVGNEKITVSAPIAGRQSAFPISFSISSYRGVLVAVSAVDDQETAHTYEDLFSIPDDMSSAEYFGTQRMVIGIRTDLAYLVSGDLDRLLEWLAVSCRSGSAASDPHLKAKDRVEACSREAGHALALAILGFALPFLGVISLIWSITIRKRLTYLGQTKGRRATAWAIALGIYETVLLVAVTIFQTMR